MPMDGSFTNMRYIWYRVMGRLPFILSLLVCAVSFMDINSHDRVPKTSKSYVMVHEPPDDGQVAVQCRIKDFLDFGAKSVIFLNGSWSYLSTQHKLDKDFFTVFTSTIPSLSNFRFNIPEHHTSIWLGIKNDKLSHIIFPFHSFW